jgi:hypothetical protein
VKPVNLNQLLFHPKSDSLSFFIPFVNDHNQSSDLNLFIDDIISELINQEKTILLKKLEKYRPQIKKMFKSHPDKSHGFFFAADLQGYTILQNQMEPYFVIGQNFHVRPLLEELFVNPEFFLVSLSLYDIKIYRGDFQQIEIIQQYEFDELPKNFNDTGLRVYAPQYLGLVPYKNILSLKTIAQKVKDMILYESLPVIVTGIDEMKNIFLRFFDDSSGIITNFQDDFYEKNCMEILEKCKKFRYAITDFYSAQLKERLKRMMKSRFMMTDLEQIIKATFAGNVLHLVIPSEQKIWGVINHETGEFTIHKKVGKTSIDILNELAEEVIRRGGRIQILVPHFFPQDVTVFAFVKV